KAVAWRSRSTRHAVHVTNYGGAMHSYRERLLAPLSWWITLMITMFTFGSIVWFGFPPWVALVTYAVLFAITAAFLLNWGRATIEVSRTELIADGSRLPLGV